MERQHDSAAKGHTVHERHLLCCKVTRMRRWLTGGVRDSPTNANAMTSPVYTPLSNGADWEHTVVTVRRSSWRRCV